MLLILQERWLNASGLNPRGRRINLIDTNCDNLLENLLSQSHHFS